MAQNTGQKPMSRTSQIYKAAQYAIVTGSVMVAAIGLGRGGLEGFVYLFLFAVAASAILVYVLLLVVIFPLNARRSDLDALSIGLVSMVVLPVFTCILLYVIFGKLPTFQVPITAIPLIASVVYGALIGAHLKRLEDSALNIRSGALEQ